MEYQTSQSQVTYNNSGANYNKSVCMVLSSHVEVSKIFEGEGENVLLTTKKKNIMAKDHHNIMIIKHSLYFFLKPYMELGAK